MKVRHGTILFGAPVLIAIAGVGIWFGMSQAGRWSAVSAAEIAEFTESRIVGLGQSITSGQIFHFKSKDYQAGRLGPEGPGQYPDDVVFETWLRVDNDGHITESVTTMRNTEGDLLQYAVRDGDSITQTDVNTGTVFEFDLAPDTTTLVEWMQTIAARPQELARDEDAEFVGRGTLGNATSVIFEYEHEGGALNDGSAAPAGVIRLEYVEADPLLNRQTHYLVDAASNRTAIQWAQTIEYQVLPKDTQMPTFP